MILVFASISFVLRIFGKAPEQNNSPITKVSFVYSYDSKIRDTAGKEELMGAIKFFFMSMKEHVNNSIGPLILNHLHEKMEKLYTYLVNSSNSEELAAEKITRAISQHFLVDPI